MRLRGFSVDMAVVYIVDDQIINLRILARFAQSLGVDVTVLTFDDARQALKAFDTQPPDLIVTDFVMPTMDGETFIGHCRRHAAAVDTPIIVVTAYEDRGFRYRALDSGASDFLLSPVDGREFCIRARNLLTLRSHQLAERERATALEGKLEIALHRHAEDMRRKEEQLRRVVNTVPALISATRRDGTICLLNNQHQAYAAISAPAGAGLTMNDLFGAEYGARHRRIDNEILAGGEPPGAFEEWVTDADGGSRVLLTTKAALTTVADAAADGVVTVSLDITDRKQQEQAVAESEARFRSLVEGSVLGILIERDGMPLFANPTLARLFGHADEDEILSLDNVDSLFPPDEHERIRQIRQTTMAGDSHGELTEFGGVKKNGNLIWLQAQAQRVSWMGEYAVQLTVADVTLRKAYELQLQKQANFDSLTTLPNRLLMMDRLRGAIISAERHKHRGAVLFIDLDHFKKINDTLGHAVGDTLLRDAADRLSRCVRGEDTVARIGGDEFTIILPNIGSAANAEPVVQKILQAFAEPFLLSNVEAVVSASIGITIFPDDSSDPAILMKNADVAMYRSKERGRNTFEFFTKALNTRASEQIRIETCLRHALARSEMSVHFQPIIDVRSERLAGAEARLHWQNAKLGLVPPERFMPCAEETGLIVPIRAWGLDEACRQWSRWRAAGTSPGRLVVDVSVGHERVEALLKRVRSTLDGQDLDGDWLELEVSERSLLHGDGHSARCLRAVGLLALVQVAVDEFGAEAASLTTLRDIAAREIRLAAAFFSAAMDNSRQTKIIEAIVAMAHRLGIRVVAKGVDSERHFLFARATGCDLAQGLHFAGPLAPAEFIAWAKQRGLPDARFAAGTGSAVPPVASRLHDAAH